jgi:molecular chaperone DnaK (HSP70)
MKLGIDFGTTRVIVASVDRGNYPLVPFETPEGAYDWCPSLAAVRRNSNGAERRFGWDAWDVQTDPGWTVLRSLKRHLENAGPQTRLAVDGLEIPLTELLGGLTASLHQQLAARFGATEPLEAMLGVPANANSNQRFLTVDAFRRAGFSVLGLLNEPSAASIEFGHRQRAKGRILVYDLGGGTFDVSLVSLEGGTHTVLASEGISNLGGDDFDLVLAELAAGKDLLYSLMLSEVFRLDEECRRQKEALHPNSRKIVVDLDAAREGLGQATVSVADFYEQCRPLLEESLRATARMAEGQEIEVLYVTGGGSELPLVARVLREEFGRKVKRSEYTRSATAIGLAIQADATSGYRLREMFTRNFGVWRERDAGRRMIFDPIFPRGTRLPGAGEPPLTVRRVYEAVHNIGHFRYIEAGEVGPDGQPAGDIAVWDEILFPFDPALADARPLEGLAVARSGGDGQIEERYACDAAGVVTVTIRNLTSQYEREFQLGRWSEKAAVVRPALHKRARRAAT